MTRILLRVLPFACAALIAAAPVFDGPATASERSPTISTNHTAYAIQGYDPVAYFDEGKPEKGSPNFTADWQGATWTFASAAHRDKFQANPDQYAPQFGGYCAYAVAKGHTAPGDPNIWAIVDDKLYLNYSPSTQEKWEADRSGMIAAGLANWPGVLGGAGASGGSVKADR